ncbi:hypothetical protein [Bifidobacterium eulemuris]|nr:hypothetical protein [Bifidobacterium eulemuris]
MTDLRARGHVEGFDVYFNPVNHRMICERQADLATVLFDYPSYHVVHNWGVSENELSQLRKALMKDVR